MLELLILWIGSFTVALLYAMVGHGGATGFLALQAFLNIDPNQMRFNALVLNLFVSSIAFFQFKKATDFSVSRYIVPLLMTSMPFTFLGALYVNKSSQYQVALGVFLIFMSVLLITPKQIIMFRQFTLSSKQHQFILLCMGAIIGFASGFLGIGGGVILSPILILMISLSSKNVAVISSLFIFANSAIGLLTTLTTKEILLPLQYPMIAFAILGAILGAKIGAHKLRSNILQYVLAIMLFLASFKILLSIAY